MINFFKSCAINIIISILDILLHFNCSFYQYLIFGGKKRFGGEFGIWIEDHLKDNTIGH
jgi:hypothetical protein